MKTNVDFGRVTLRLITCLSFFTFLKFSKTRRTKCFVPLLILRKHSTKFGEMVKLLLNNMNGNMYNIIVNMYSGTKSCISYNDCKSEFFPCNNGVREGEN